MYTSHHFLILVMTQDIEVNGPSWATMMGLGGAYAGEALVTSLSLSPTLAPGQHNSNPNPYSNPNPHPHPHPHPHRHPDPDPDPDP